MNAKRTISPAVIISLVMVAMLVLVGIIGFTGRGRNGQGQQGQEAAPLVDNGPSAALSNDELVSAAISNMKALTSYAVDFEGLKPARSANPATRMTMSGHEIVGKGMKLSMRGERTGNLDTALKSWTILDAFAPQPPGSGQGTAGLRGNADVIVLGDRLYESSDGGRTWSQSPEDEDMSGVAPLAFVCTWDTAAWGGESTWPACGSGAGLLKFGDAEPTTEPIGEVPTRHLTIDLLAARQDTTQEAPPAQGLMVAIDRPEAMTLEVWISTDTTPRLRRMRVDVATPPTGNSSDTELTPAVNAPNITYSLTWTWSHFNEDLGEVTPPSADKIKQP